MFINIEIEYVFFLIGIVIVMINDCYYHRDIFMHIRFLISLLLNTFYHIAMSAH